MGRKPLVVLDGAHNLEAFQELRRALRQFFPYRRLILVLGILADKAVTDMLMEIVPQADTLIVTRPDNPRAADPAELGRIIRTICNKPVFLKEEAASALECAFALASPDDLILIAGSLYLLSEVHHLLQRAGSK